MLLVEQYTSIWYERVAKGIAVLRGGVRAIWLATRAPVNRSGLPPRPPGVAVRRLLWFQWTSRRFSDGEVLPPRRDGGKQPSSETFAVVSMNS